MTNNMMQQSDWPDRMPATDPVKQLFDRVFERRSPRCASSKDPTVLSHQWIPHVDIKEEAHRFIVYVDAPGVMLASVEAHLEKGVLTIKGERKTESQDCRGSFMRVERRHGPFHRRFALPASADPKASRLRRATVSYTSLCASVRAMHLVRSGWLRQGRMDVLSPTARSMHLGPWARADRKRTAEALCQPVLR